MEIVRMELRKTYKCKRDLVLYGADFLWLL